MTHELRLSNVPQCSKTVTLAVSAHTRKPALEIPVTSKVKLLHLVYLFKSNLEN